MAIMRAIALTAALIFVSGLPSVAAGVLRVGSDISYAPLEFYGGASKAVQGFDYDLARAVAAQMGEQLAYQNHDFNDLMHALGAGRFDAVMSAMSDTRDRERKADFIDYFVAGTGMLVQAGNPHRVYTLGSLCGMTADLQRGSSQEAAVRAQSADCTAIGLKPVHVLAYPTDEEALKHFLAGESDAHISDYPVVAYLARTLDGGTRYQVAGRQFGVVPYGIAVAKNNPALRTRLQSALERVIADGTYDRLLKKWGLEQGAMRSAPIDAGTLFQ